MTTATKTTPSQLLGSEGKRFRLMIEAACRDIMDRRVPRSRQDRTGLCLYWAEAMTEALNRAGLRSCINAGTANWRCNDFEEPHDTHVGHFWQDERDGDILAKYLMYGVLPEMHCWAVVPELSLIVDPTTQFVRELAADNNIPFTLEQPPECLWATADSLPYGWMYVADERATKIAYRLLGQS